MTSQFEHYYTPNPKSELKKIETKLILRNGHEYLFITPSGVFSFGHVDRASRTLIENAKIHGKSLLDIGCGYGVVGITLAKENPALTLSMSDINSRAVEFAKINAKNQNIQPSIAIGFLYNPWSEQRFDMILCNPPMAAGKAIWKELISKAPEHLNPGGSIQIVAFHNKGGERLMNHMRFVMGNVQTLVKSGGVRVYFSCKEGDPI